MPQMLEIVAPSGTEDHHLDDEYVRIGSAPDSSIVVEGLAEHSVTVRKVRGRTLVTNRLSESVLLGSKKLAPDESSAWRVGKTLKLSTDVSITLKRKRRQTSTKTNWGAIFVVGVAGTVIWLCSQISFNAESLQDSRRRHVLSAINEISDESINAEERAARTRIFGLIQDGALEDCRGNRELAKGYYSRAHYHAQRIQFFSDTDYKPVTDFLREELKSR